MGPRLAWSVKAVGVAAILMLALPASAQMFFDLYGGASFPGKPDFTLETDNRTSREVEAGESDTVATGGARFGYWFGDLGLPWLGVAGDVSYFEPEFTGPGGGTLAKVKVRTVPMTPLVMLRLPLLQTPEYPVGRLQLYAGAGPGFFWTEQSARFLSGGTEKVSDDTIEVGVDARAGIAWRFLPNWRVFTEYRFTYYSISPEGTINGQRAKVEADLDTHHFLMGIGFDFK
jgi:opacity protein-like surface antigen